MAALIALDWGTSSLRAYLLDGAGAILERRRRPWGLRSLPQGGFNAALAEITHGWPRCPRIAAGMVGARGGWHEMPYLELPAGLEAVAGALHPIEAADGLPLYLVPGLRDAGGPDVMRGEETQIFGAIALAPELAAGATLVLPGTHSKWAQVRDGRVCAFRTAMTGELYALLLRHSILGAGIEPDAVADDGDAFLQGLEEARASGDGGALARLFALRARMLDGSLASARLPSLLSGLLIGDEIRALSAGAGDDGPITLVGERALRARYRLALQAFGLAATTATCDAAAAGLWRIACTAARGGRFPLSHESPA